MVGLLGSSAAQVLAVIDCVYADILASGTGMIVGLDDEMMRSAVGVFCSLLCASSLNFRRVWWLCAAC